MFIIKKAKEFLFEQMGAHMKENLKKIILMGLALIFGGIKGNMLDIGIIIVFLQ